MEPTGGTEPDDPIEKLNYVGPVVVNTKLVRRFYAAVTLLLALNQGYKDNAKQKMGELPYAPETESEGQLFLNFVSRLGQICDSRPGGHTVTAVAVLQHPDRKEYVFASNQRSAVELEIVRAYLHVMLTKLGESLRCRDDKQQEEFSSNLLRDILNFNRERVKRYLNGLTEALTTCLIACEKEGTPQAEDQQKKFRKLLELVLLANERRIDDDDFLDRAEILIAELQTLNLTTDLFIRKRAGDDGAGNPEPWREFRHHASRIVAYKRAVDVLWYSSHVWPGLFEDFEVTAIPSSSRSPNPLKTEPLSATNILTNLLPTEDKAKYLGFAGVLPNGFELDQAIKDLWIKSKFRPIIHAEILVLNSLETSPGGTRPERFFQNRQCIGSSKPACKLCHYYFSNHPSGVKIRGAHDNLYQNWRMPDLADVSGLRTEEEAAAKRRDIMAGVSGQLRGDVQRVLSEKVADYKPHDSNTLSSFAVRSSRAPTSVGPFNALATKPGEIDRSQSPSNEEWETMVTQSEMGDEGGKLTEEGESPPSS